MILLIDNYDSFVHNLARYVRELGAETRVVRNDAIDVAGALALKPSHVIVSPGPRTPREAGVSNALIRALGPTVPILGVCLGHQCLAAALGGAIVRGARPRHGKTSPIHHDGRGVFAGLPSPFDATRYHSLVAERETLPASLEVVAWTPEEEIMGIRHRTWPSWGVQFHPESVLTQQGHALLRNFLAIPGGARSVIVETLVTTLDREGSLNVAPMGVVWGEDEIVLKPYRETTTFRNLSLSPEAVVNLVDDVVYYVRAALTSPTYPAQPATVVRGMVLEVACSWRELRVRESDTSQERARFVCEVVHRGTRREFIGYNRARNAVLEATILATRTRFLPIDGILAEYARLQVIVDKTAGPAEREAMALLAEFVRGEAIALGDKTS